MTADLVHYLKLVWEVIKVGIGVLVVVASGLAAIEAIFKPFRKRKENREAKREAEAQAEKERLNREKRIDESLVKVDTHLEESLEIAKWQKEVDKRLEEHSEAIKDSKNERRVLWKAQRATLDGLKQLGANGMVSGAITEMDDYVDNNIR